MTAKHSCSSREMYCRLDMIWFDHCTGEWVLGEPKWPKQMCWGKGFKDGLELRECPHLSNHISGSLVYICSGTNSTKYTFSLPEVFRWREQKPFLGTMSFYLGTGRAPSSGIFFHAFCWYLQASCCPSGVPTCKSFQKLCQRCFRARYQRPLVPFSWWLSAFLPATTPLLFACAPKQWWFP